MNKKHMRTIIALIVAGILLSILGIELSGIYMESRPAHLVATNDYDAYLFYKRRFRQPSLLKLMGNNGKRGYKVWVIPWKKTQLLESIEEDVRRYCEEKIQEHPDLLKGYEINDNFSQVTIWYDETVRKTYPNKDDIMYDSSIDTYIGRRIELYHEFSRTPIEQDIGGYVKFEHFSSDTPSDEQP